MRLTLVVALSLIAALAPHARAQTWQVSATPTVTIDRPSAAPYSLVSAGKLSDGRIVIATEGILKFYDAAGKFMLSTGGRGPGMGMGEFVQDMLVLPGDTLLTLTVNVGRGMDIREIAWLLPNGKPRVRFVEVDQRTLIADGWTASIKRGSLLANGNLLAEQWRPTSTPSPTELTRKPARYVILNPAAGTVTPLTTLSSFRSSEAAYQVFSPTPQYAIGRDRVYVGDNDTTLVAAFALSGAPAATFNVERQTVAVTTRDVDALRDRAIARLGTDTARANRVRRMQESMPVAEHFPQWGMAVVDRAGNLWTSPPGQPGAHQLEWFQGAAGQPNEWRVYTREGRPITRVTLPAAFRPIEIGADYILGVSYDASDVERVQVYALNRAQ